MMRDSRRRSPQAESSRRRRRERERERDRDRDPQRKSSRDQTTTTAVPTADTPDYQRSYGKRDSYSRGIITEDRDRSASFPTGSASASKPWMGENPDYYTTEPDAMPPHSSQPTTQPRSRARGHTRVPSSSGSDSSSPSYLDISRRYDTSRFGGVLTAFFRAPSEHRRQQRRVKNKAKKRAVFAFGNSSSSSVNSDLAYGEGYIPQARSSRRRSRSNGPQRQEYGDPFQPGKLQRRQTDEEIVAIGRQLSDLAKRQNDDDLRAAGRSRPSKIVSAAAGLTALSQLRKGKKDGARGIGSSKPTGGHSDDEDWESASDDDSSDDASALAYGASKTNLPGVLGGAAAAAAGAGALWASHGGRRASDQQPQYPAVDPSLFGPVNSLNGMVTPIPFKDDERHHESGYDRRRDAHAVPDSVINAPMREVYPFPTSRPDQFDARHSGSVSGSRSDHVPKVSRPGPAPIQAPVPISPVPSKVYNAQGLEKVGNLEERERPRALGEETRGIGSTARMSFGTAATAAIAAATFKTYHQRGRDEDYRSYAKVAPKKLHRSERTDYDRRRSEQDVDFPREARREHGRDRDRIRDKERERDGEREYRRSKDSVSKSKEDREYKRSSRYDEVDERFRKSNDASKEKDRRSYRREEEDIKVEYDGDQSSRQSRREEKLPANRDLTKDLATGAIVAGGAALAAGALASRSAAEAPERPLTPAVFTVDREPSFDDWPPRSPSPDVRLSRKDSFEMEKIAEDKMQHTPRSGQEYDDNAREAKAIYDEAKQATVPVGVGAVAAAVAAETYRGRERRRDEYSDDGSRERSGPAKDTVQEEADRYYREAQAARKVAEEEARSRSRSKGRGQEEEQPEISVVTPPGYEEEKKLDKSPYDAPNADVRIDNEIYPADTHRFRVTGADLDAPIFKSRDPSAERERPLLNLVMPTPTPSRQPTPALSNASKSEPAEENEQSGRSSKRDKKDKKKDKKKGKKSKDRDAHSDTPGPGIDVVIGPKGDIQTPSTPKSVTWGENETKSFVVESPEHERKDTSEKERPRLNKTSKWGILAAAIAGSSTEPANEPDLVTSESIASPATSSKTGDRSLDDIEDPPTPGPKPGAVEVSHMPGSFADDVEFAGTLAAGLEDAGFDPNIVVNDPSYRRRDSPPGSDELHESGFYKKGFSSTVEDLSKSGDPMTPGSGLVIGENQTAKEETPDELAETPTKISKKEKRKQEKLAAAKRQSIDFEEITASHPTEIQLTDDVADIPLSKKEQNKRAKAAKAKALAGDDDWETAGQGTETPTSQTQGTETPLYWEAGEEDWEAPSSKKKKSKNRKSKDAKEPDVDKAFVPADAFDDVPAAPREINAEDDWDAPKKKKKKSKSSSSDSPSQSAPTSEVGSESGTKKSKRRSVTGDDFNEWDGDPPDRKRVDPFEERDVSSVVSEPRYNDRRSERKSRRSSRFEDDDDTKSVASAPGGSHKSKDEKRSSGIFSSIFSKSNGHKDDGKKDSFLDNAGTLGAGVGLAGVAAVMATAASSRQHATEASSEIEQPTTRGSETTREIEDTFDPEIVPRAIKPAIDPQYGDLLPLPPSEPGSPKETPVELPELPDSRPDTPPEERSLREQERMAHVRRRSTQETPTKSPSRTAIPIQLRLGPRSNPGTPGFLKSSPLNSPNTPDSAGASKRSARPTSWDSSRGPIPLQLPRHVRHGSTGTALQEADLSPISGLQSVGPMPTSLETGDPVEDVRAAESIPLRLDIGDLQPANELAGSQETTPKAEIRPEFPTTGTEASTSVTDNLLEMNLSKDVAPEASHTEVEPEPVDTMSKNRSSYLLNSTPSSIRSDRSVDAVSLVQSPGQEPSPSKQQTLGVDLSDIPEGFTSADEHFSDAREGQSEDDFFEEARSVLSSELSGGSPENATPTRSTFAEAIPSEPQLSIVTDPEWGTSASKKKRKKGKKTAMETSTAAAWDAHVDESMVSTPIARPFTSNDGLSSEADIPAVAVSAPIMTESSSPEQLFSGEKDSASHRSSQVLDAACASSETPVEEPGLVQAPSKKDRRKKKKDKQQKQTPQDFPTSPEGHQQEEETGPGFSKEQPDLRHEDPGHDSQRELPSDDQPYFPSTAGLHMMKSKLAPPGEAARSHDYFPSAACILPTAIPATVTAGLSLKDYWNNDGDNRVNSAEIVEQLPPAEKTFNDKDELNTDHLQAADSWKDYNHSKSSGTLTSGLLSSQDDQTIENSQQTRDTTQAAEDSALLEHDATVGASGTGEDEWSTSGTAKKSKKNKKRKSAVATSLTTLESEQNPEDKPLEPEGTPKPADAFVADTTLTLDEPIAEHEPSVGTTLELGDDDWATTTTSKKKAKKNKKKQAATVNWDETQPESTLDLVENAPVGINESEISAETSHALKEPQAEIAPDAVAFTESPVVPSPAEDPDDEWALPKSGKAKKERKNRPSHERDVTAQDEPMSHQAPPEAPPGEPTTVKVLQHGDVPGETCPSEDTPPPHEPGMPEDPSIQSRSEKDHEDVITPPAQPIEPVDDEWAPIGRKSKGKKKNKKPTRVTLDEESIEPPKDSPPPPVDTHFDPPTPAADAATESEIPKKGKKGKKNRKTALSAWDEESITVDQDIPGEQAVGALGALEDSPTSEPEDQAGAASTEYLHDAIETDKLLNTGTDNNSSDGTQSSPSQPLQGSTTEELTDGNDFETSGQRADDLASSLRPTDFGTPVGYLQNSTDPAVERHDAALAVISSTNMPEETEQPTETHDQTEQALPNADDVDFFFPVKKKSKKGKKRGSEPEQDDKVISFTAPANDETLPIEVPVDVGCTVEEQNQIEQVEGPAPPVAVLAAGNQSKNDADLGFAVQSSKRDKKQKRKGKGPAFEEPKFDDTPVPEPDTPAEVGSEPMIPSGAQAQIIPPGDSDDADTSPSFDNPTIETVPQADEEWTGSTKDKKDQEQKQRMNPATLDWTDDGPRQDDSARKASEAALTAVNRTDVDSWESSSVSKKDKKKKKKKKRTDLEWDQVPQEPPVGPTPEVESGTATDEGIVDPGAAPLQSELVAEGSPAEAEDEWAMKEISKKDKKSKKNKNQAELDWSLDEKPQDDDCVETCSGDAVSQATPEQPGAVAEDEWVIPPVTKKDKKKKKKQAALDWTDKSMSPQDLDTAGEASVHAVEEAPDDTWNTPVLSKMDKKKRKKAAAVAWQDEEPTQADEATAEVEHSVKDTSAEAKATPDQGTSALVDSEETLSEAVSVKALETSTEPADFPSASLDDPELEDGFSLSKKEKKNKKKAKAAMRTWSNDESVQTPEEMHQLSGALAEPHFDQHETRTYKEPAADQTAFDWPRQHSWDDPEPSRDEDEDSWDVTAPKSKKKKAKAALDQVTPRRSPTPESTIQLDSTLVAPLLTTTHTSNSLEDDDDEWAALVTGTKPSKTEEPEQLPGIRSYDLDRSSSCDPPPEGAGDTITHDAAPEEIATISDLRQILSGQAEENHHPDSQTALDNDINIKGNENSSTAIGLSSESDRREDGARPTLDDVTQPITSYGPVVNPPAVQGSIDLNAEDTDAVSQDPQAEPEDSWAVASKLSKKDKKKKRQSIAFEDVSAAPPTAENDQENEATETEKPGAILVEVQDESTELSQKSSLPQEIPTVSEPEFDDWKPKKLSKKDQKKAAKAARLAALESGEPAPISSEPVEATEQEVATAAEPEFDDLTQKKLSKKDQKKAEKAARLAALKSNEPAFSPSEPTEQAIQDVVANPVFEEEAPLKPEAEPDFDDWAPRKMSKKEKKAAEKAARLAVLGAEKSIPEVVDVDPALESEIPIETPAEKGSIPSSEVAVNANTELDWDVSASKKLSKKDKKKAEKVARLAGLATIESAPGNGEPVQIPVSETEVDEVERSAGANGEEQALEATPPLEAPSEADGWVHEISKSDEEKTENATHPAAPSTKGFESAEIKPEDANIVTETQQEPSDHPLENKPIERLAPKMSKKDKKKAAKAAQLAALENEEPITETPDHIQFHLSDEPINQDRLVASEDPFTHEQESVTNELASKLSENEKQGAEEATRLTAALSTPDEPAVEGTELPLSTTDNTPMDFPEIASSANLVQDIDDWTPKTSKKEKKKAQKPARFAALATEDDASIDAPQTSLARSEDLPSTTLEEPTGTERIEQSIEGEAQDEWAPKMSKKDKKKAEKAARLAVLAQDEAAANKSPIEDDAAAHSTETSEPFNSEHNSQPDFDDWAPKKQSKKDRKQAERLAKAAQSIPDETTTDLEPLDLVMENAEPVVDKSSSLAAQDEPSVALDECVPKKVSKKDKKKADKLARAAELSAGVVVAGGTLALLDRERGQPEQAKLRDAIANEGDGIANQADGPLEQQPNYQDVNDGQGQRDIGLEHSEQNSAAVKEDEGTEEQGYALGPPQQSIKVPEDPSARESQTDTAKIETVPEDDEWALPVKKKGKKNRKNTVVVSISEQEASAQQDVSDQRAGEQPMLDENPSAAPELTDADVANENEWAMPIKLSEKSKKGKKNGSQDATSLETSSVMSSPKDEPEPYPELQQFTSISAVPPDQAPAPDEESWDAPLKTGKTKKKKGTKRASQEHTPLQTPRTSSPPPVNSEARNQLEELQDDVAETPISVSAVDDDWTSGFTASKSRKKNQGRNSTSPHGTDSGPSANDHTITEPLASPETTPPHLQPAVFPRPKDDEVAEIATGQAPEPAQAFQESGSQPAELTTKNVALTEDVISRDTSASEVRPDSVSHGEEFLSEALSGTHAIGKEDPTDKSPQEDKGSTSAAGALGNAATGAAALSGVAAIAERFGGSKKKKGSKKKQILDKRQPREDDLFDDPALWESADKKALEDIQVPQETEDFWNADDTTTQDAEIVEHSAQHGDGMAQAEARGKEQSKSQEKTPAVLPTPSSISPASESGWKETSRQGARLDDEFEESPITGRGETDQTRSMAAGLLRLGSDASEPESGLLREDSHARSLAGERNPDNSDFRRSPSRGLPVVQEVPEAEPETSRELWPGAEINRDSGFVAGSPNSLHRQSEILDKRREGAQRDSGIHTDEWEEKPPNTPGNLWEHKLRRSPRSTPRLQEPLEQAATPEPEKQRTKNYGSLADESTPARGLFGAGAAAASTSTGRGDSDPRSFSEGHARMGREQGASPAPSLSSQRGEHSLRRTASNTSIVRQRTPEPLKFRPESPGIRSTPTPPLRRVNGRISTELPSAPASRETNTPKPVANETKVRVRDKDKDMTDVYDGFGEGRIGSPRSPTRPHSMRRRQSMQVLELESKVDQLLAENRLLTEARNQAEQSFSQRATSVLSEREAEIETLKQSLQFLQNEVSRLTEVNEGLASANAELASKDNSRYADLEVSGGDGARGLELAAGGAAGAAAGAAATVASYEQTIQGKDDEIAELRAQLEDAKEKIREMQRQILASKAGEAEFLEILDEDHFDHRCQQLCSHVQQWVLRFSKFSDMRACRLTSEINDEKTIDRLDNAVLDGSDVDVYLKDRVRRRDIFMSMTMNMIWEFVFTRYLFGMDREQRQKLKSLEKLLTEVGPPQAVRQWRAVTLTLLSRRHSFKEQRDLDTEAVVQAIFQTLCKILPPPSNLEDQIQAQLRRVMAEAVALSIQMRTQKAEYMMLPPLQPEYDADGELAASVYFNASMMNERSGNSTVSNEELEAQQAKVRIVLFPLVVKKGDDAGIGDEEIVVCPAQVVVASRHSRRSFAPSSDAGGASLGGAPSRVSVVTEHMA